MRIFGAILGVILLLLGAVYFVAFTSPGNNIVKPYIEDTLSEKLQKNVKLEKFNLSMSHLSIQAEVPNEAALIVDGDINIFSQSFNLLYHAQAQNLKTPTMIIKEKLEVDGSVKGDMDDFLATGNGKALGSNVDFNVHLVDKMPQNGTINAKGLQTAQILQLIGKPAYASGKIDIDAKIKNENQNLSGTAVIVAKDGKLDSKLIQRDFNVTLPKGLMYVAKINGVVKDNALNAKSNIVTSLATLKSENTNVNLKDYSLKTDYDLNIPNLTKLAFLTKKTLHGAVHVTGDVVKNDKDLIVHANSNIFDGKFDATLKNNALLARAKSFDIKKILAFLGEPAMAYGKLNLEATVDDITKDNKEAIAMLALKNGEFVGSILRSRYGLNFPPVSSFSSLVNTKLKGNALTGDAEILSSLLNLKASNIKADIATQNFSTDFSVDTVNLAPLGKIANQKLQGAFSANGNVGMSNKQLSFDAHTSSLGGKIDATMKQNTLKATLKNVAVEKIIYLLAQPKFASGLMDATADFSSISVPNVNGKFNYTLNNGQLLGKGLKELTGSTYPASIPFAIKSDIDVKNGIANFANSINSNLASVPNFKGVYDIGKNELDSAYTIDIKDLSKLAFLTNQKLNGPLSAKGIVQMKNGNIKATADAPILGGQSKSDFDKNILTVKATNISIKGLSSLMDYPYVFDSNGDFNLNYNTKSKKGKYGLFMKEGHMVANQLSNTVKTFTQYDMTNEVYKDTILKGVINGDNVTYLLDLNGSQTSLNIPNGTLNTLTKQTKADFKLKFQKTDLKGSIKGNISSPKVNIKSSDYLKNKAVDKIGKELDKHLDGDKSEIVKDLLKLF